MFQSDGDVIIEAVTFGSRLVLARAVFGGLLDPDSAGIRSDE